MPTANTPAEPGGARVARFPTAGSLPRFNGGSASAVRVSRPARGVHSRCGDRGEESRPPTMGTSSTVSMRRSLPERIGTYLQAAQGDRQQALRLYTWNTAICAAFYGPLQAIEIEQVAVGNRVTPVPPLRSVRAR